MKEIGFRLRQPVILFPLLILGVTGCEIAAPTKSQTAPQVDLSQETIQPGWGIPSCHLGMKRDDCIARLGQPDSIQTMQNDPFADSVESHFKYGLMVAYINGLVVQVCFIYLSDEVEYSPFPGMLTESISSRDSIASVVAQYGQPPEIYPIRVLSRDLWEELTPDVEYPSYYREGSIRSSYEYPALGLDVYVIDSKIEVIRVYEPEGRR